MRTGWFDEDLHFFGIQDIGGVEKIVGPSTGGAINIKS